MTIQAGIYRGSFDPPHNGHLEAINCALKEGISPIIITYKDTNQWKPFRSDNEVRQKLLMAMFANMPNVVISSKPYKVVLNDLSKDPTIGKIYQIIGSDLLNLPVRSLKHSDKLAYFVHPREDYPFFKNLQTWNNLPIKIGSVNPQTISPSSSHIRSLLKNREFEKAQHFFPPQVFEKIVQENLFVPTDNEYPFRRIIWEVKKNIENIIVEKKLITKEDYPLSFYSGKDAGISGLSGDLIYFVADKNKKIHIVVKIFIGDNYEERYKSELLGYKIIDNLNLSLVRVPTLFAFELKTDFALIGMKYINGKSLAELMNDSPEAIRLCARANLELHLAQRAANIAISANQIAPFEKSIQRVIDKLTVTKINFLTSDMISQLKIRWVEMHKAFLSNPGQLSFTHGDPNHNNWIVDLEHQYVTYIDLSQFVRSVEDQKNPYGFAINELEESLLSFKIAGKCQALSKDKIREIQNIYRTEYLTAAPLDIMTKEARQYFAAYWILRVIESILRKLNKASGIEKTKYELRLQDQLDLFFNLHIHN